MSKVGTQCNTNSMRSMRVNLAKSPSNHSHGAQTRNLLQPGKTPVEMLRHQPSHKTLYLQFVLHAQCSGPVALQSQYQRNQTYFIQHMTGADTRSQGQTLGIAQRVLWRTGKNMWRNTKEHNKKKTHIIKWASWGLAEIKKPIMAQTLSSAYVIWLRNLVFVWEQWEPGPISDNFCYL